MRPDPPRWLLRAGSWLLRRRLPPALAAEAEGDLRELWTSRREKGRRDLRRAWCADLASLLLRRRRPAFAIPTRTTTATAVGQGATGMLHDVRHAVRLMRRQPLFASLTILTLALGIAASTGIFTTVDRLLLQPLPYPEPERLMAVRNPPYAFGGGRMSVPSGLQTLGVFSGVGLYAPGGLNVDSLGGPIRVEATVASPGFFEAMAVRPQIGRAYRSDEDVPGANAVAVISDGLWRRHAGADPDVLVRPLHVNGRAYRVTGVMPPGFTFPGRTDVWIPVAADIQATGDAFGPQVVARLAPGATRELAEAALARYDRERGAPADADPPTLVPLQRDLTATVRPTLLLLAVSVGLVLLVSTANVAGLLLARVTRRQSELVLRRALGASRWRLARLLCVEALTFAAVAGALGAAGGTIALRVTSGLSAEQIPSVNLAAVDARMLAVAVAVSALTGLLFGLAPGLAAAGSPAAHVVRAGTTVTTGRGWRWFRNGMIVVQVAVALVLLSGTTVTLQTMTRLLRVELGFSGESVLGVEVTPPLATYETPGAVSSFVDRSLERLRAIPGVRAAAATGRLPGDRTVGVGIAIDRPGANRPADAPPQFATLLSASPGYFETMGIRLVAGRSFTAADGRGAPRVVILSESAARMLWPDGANPVGQRVEAGVAGPLQTAAVVGVVGDVLLQGPGVAGRPQFYRPLAQGPPFGFVSFAILTSIDPRSVAPAVRAAIESVDPTLPVYNVQDLGQAASRFLTSHRLALTLMGGFALMTLVLAAVGLYGVLAQLVAQRTRELGIRMALGADPGRLRRGVVWLGLRLAAAGAAIGVVATGIAGRLVAAFVPSLDPLTWPTIALDAGVLVAAALFAAWMPARRAASVDVVTALRE